MEVLYKKPEIKSYSGEFILNEVGPIQTQYVQFKIQSIPYSYNANSEKYADIVYIAKAENKIVQLKKIG